MMDVAKLAGEIAKLSKEVPSFKQAFPTVPDTKDTPSWGKSADAIPDLGNEVSDLLSTIEGDNTRDGIPQITQNKLDGIQREETVLSELQEQFSEKDGFTVLREQLLRDKDGNIVKDPVTGEARRIDFVVIDKDGNVVKMVEVTSETAPKDAQTAKENRIRDAGGNNIRNSETGLICRIPDNVTSEIDRRA
jgi:hypothetical protein